MWSSEPLDASRLASVSMGYEIGVTPVQMVMAASTIANGGKLLEPHFVQTIIRGGAKERIAPRVIRQVISAETASTVTTMMEGVVQRGTATAAQLPGYSVAGKTGTAKKVVRGGYSSTDYNASFVGFVPSRSPRFTILVVIDTPRAGSYYGGTVAAPIFQKIAAAAVQYAGIAPDLESHPPVIMRPSTPDSGVVRTAAHGPGTFAPAGGPGLMPDVVGLPAREAVRMLATFGLTPRLAGTGFVVAQRPAAGSALPTGGLAALELRRVSAFAGSESQP
jgi:membrane peptidoglycan carboxypeptidase